MICWQRCVRFDRESSNSNLKLAGPKLLGQLADAFQCRYTAVDFTTRGSYLQIAAGSER